MLWKGCRSCVRAAFAIAWGVAAPAFAQDLERLQRELEGAPFTLSADSVSYEEERDVYEASGNVHLEHPRGASLTADWVTFSARTRIGVATGNVRIQDGSDVMTARFAEVDLNTLDAYATDATLDTAERGFVAHGSELRKTGTDTYEIADGHFTACRCPPGSRRLPWEIRVGEADLEVEGYATARDVSVCAFGVPIAYAPWLLFPVKTKRQTGFLIPRFSNSNRSGASIETPFFWAASEELNVLLRPNWQSKRGLKSGVETEYVFGERGYSEGGFAVLPGDDEVDEDDTDTRYSDDRWAFWLRHEQPLASGIRFGADVQRTSDNDYVVDFDDLPSGSRSERFLESNGWGTAARRGLFGGVETTWFDDTQSPNELDRDSLLLQRLPDVRLAALPRSLFGLPLLAAMDLRYTHFRQSDGTGELYGNLPVSGRFFDTGPDGLFDEKEPNPGGVFDGADNHLDDGVTEGDGVFQEGEPLADEGHRGDLYPRLALPAQLGPLEAVSELAWRTTIYGTRREGRDLRGFATGRVDVRTRLERGFRVRSLDLQHVLEPAVGFAFVSPRDQDGNPLFIPQGAVRPERLINGDPRLLTRNPSDRVEDERYLQFGIGNRLFAPGGDGEPRRQVLFARIGSGYDFELGRVANVFLETLFEPSPALHVTGQIGWDPKETETDEALARLDWTLGERLVVNAGYRYLRELPLVFEDFEDYDDSFDGFDEGFDRINQFNFGGSYRLWPRLELFADGHLSLEDSGGQGGRFGAVISSSCDCWDLVPSVQRQLRTGGTRFELEVRVRGFGGLMGSRR
jgi:lipopolysaccharide assembly outer membrane protein LptD (OstA)